VFVVDVHGLTIALFPLDVPGLGTAHVRVVAPAQADSEPDAVGFRPLDNGPLPTVILCPGMGCPPERLHWLAVALAVQGFAAVSYGLLQRIGPTITWSPGVDLAAAGPQADPGTPTCPVLVPLLEAIRSNPTLVSVDPSQLVLFGHSAGGSVALTSAGRRGLEDVRGVVVYGTHLIASSTSGRTAGSITTTLAPALLVLGGERDGVVQTAIDDGRYGPDVTRAELLCRSVAEGAPLAEFAAAGQVLGAGHFACLDGYDGLGSSGHMEVGAADVQSAHRDLIGALSVAFATSAVTGEYEPMDTALNDPGLLRLDGRAQ
jgi:dienelactone hydrolase